ncbi:MAG: type I-B CRISPR-associated protein Cas7/Csh2 [Thermoplasmatales archaeon B_DKE]|nr:MAG: type I-B CRISPR-associated protein Cas7/Csh2 [Thermoplasmatales archaeon B_DKE]
MVNNAEILFLYDAELTNPNGDPDDENRPRMDYQFRRNLVSDVRLKRYVRDYLQELGNEIFVESSDNGQVVDAGTRIEKLLGHKPRNSDADEIMKRLIDVRLFGATLPIKKGEEASGDSIKVTGPVQFTWGYSLNEADLVDTYSITSRFSSGEGKKQGTIGKDYRIYYSLIGFYGVISGFRAQKTGMTESDCKMLDKALLLSIPQQATRSKIGQFPRLYLRIVYKDQETVLGDWRKYVNLTNKKNLRRVEEVKLDLTSIINRLKENVHRIEEIYFWGDPLLHLEQSNKSSTVEEMLKGVEVKTIKLSA